MALAVMCVGRDTIHLSPTNDANTYCKNYATAKAGPIIHRGQMCKKCFGRDCGQSKWTAGMLGLIRIIEDG